MRNLKTVANLLISPISPILTLAIGWLLTLSVTVENEDFPQPINYMIQHRNYIFICIFLWLLFTLLYQYHVNCINEERQKNQILQAQIKEKDRQLETSSGIILHKYGEFGEFKRNLMFREAMKQIVENSHLVDSAQLYSYTILSNQKKRVKIRVNAVTGFSGEGVVINSILQTYYELEKDVFDEIDFIVQKWKQLESKDVDMSWAERKLQGKIFTDRAMKLFDRLRNELRELKSIEELFEDEIYYNNYRVLTILYKLMTRVDDANKLPNLVYDSTKPHDEKEQRLKELEDELYKGKRTGVLGSILLKDIFMFRHVGTSSKNGRTYVAFSIPIFYQNYCILFTVDTNQIEDSQQLRSICEKHREEFVKIIRKNIQ